MIVYPDIESWQTSQGAWSSIENSLIKKETVRILRPISFESKSSLSPEDRKSIYEYQKFIKPSELAKVIRAANLELLDLSGISYNPFTRKTRIDKNVSANYIVHARKN